MKQILFEELQCKKCECVMNGHDNNGVWLYECKNPVCDFRDITRNAEYFKVASVADIYRDYGDVIKPYVAVEIRYVYTAMVDGNKIGDYDDFEIAKCEVDPDGEWNQSAMLPDMFRSNHGFAIYRQQAS